MAQAYKDTEGQALALMQMAQLEMYANLPDRAIDLSYAAQQVGGDCMFWCKVIQVRASNLNFELNCNTLERTLRCVSRITSLHCNVLSFMVAGCPFQEAICKASL